MNQRSLRKQLYILLGDLPERNRETRVISMEIVERDKYILEKLLLELNGIEPVPAYFLKPKAGKEHNRKYPLVVYNHTHGSAINIGKEEVLKGKKTIQNPPYGELLTSMGYSVLCIDHWAFGERNHKYQKEGNLLQIILYRLGLRDIPTESYTFKKMLWYGQTMWGMMVYDTIKAVDYAISRDDVEKERIATIGFSMGSTMSWWLSALDTRIKVCIDICCMTDFDELMKNRDIDKHGLYYYVPGLLKHFSTSKINSLIAPRPHLCLTGIKDPLTPVRGLNKIDKELKKIYRGFKKENCWKLLKYNTGHFENKDMRREIILFLNKWL